MIYIEQSSSSPYVYLVDDNLKNFMLMRNGFKENIDYLIFEDFNQTKLAPSILDRW